MLTNKDFAKILADGGGSGGGRSEGDGKFDLNQIRIWDQQNRAKEQKKKMKNESNKSVPAGKEEGATDMYRDRAQERRNDANPDYDAQLEAAALVNAEQTQYLGGDAEHTHLVKGLDFALLRKVRGDADKMKHGEHEGDLQEKISTSHQQSLSELTTHTTLGADLKKLLLSDRGDAIRSCGSKLRTPVFSGTGGTGSVLTRTAYQFDVDPLGEADLPTVIRRSKAVSSYGASRDDVCYVLFVWLASWLVFLWPAYLANRKQL